MKNTKKRIVSALLGISMLMSFSTMTSAAQVEDTIKMETPGSGLIAYGGDEDTDPIWYSKTSQFVQRLYEVCLGRKADEAGLKGWYDALVNKQATGIGTAYGFIYSDEFQNKNLSNGAYIECMYKAFLGRSADPAGKQAWVDALNQGYTREDIFKGFAESPEFTNICANYKIVRGDYYKGINMQQTSKVNLFVNRLYELVLNRSCDPSGLTAWSQALLKHEGSGAQVAYGMFFSPEFLGRHSCNDCYVKILYKALLGRDAAASEIEAWSSALAQGASREKVFNGFAGSKEFSLICADYGIDVGSVNYSGNTKRSGSACGICGAVNPNKKVTIASYNDEVDLLLSKYTSHEYGYTKVNIDEYQKYLDQVLASGENAPDIIVLDVAYNQKYANSSSTLSMNSIGISNSEMTDMFQYALDLGKDSKGNVKQLALCDCPSGVLYNTVVAQDTLGVSAPSQVAPYFASWSAFYNTAKTVSNVKDSYGVSRYKVVPGMDDVYRSYMGNHKNAWVTNGSVNFDSTLVGWADLYKLMFNEDLTWDMAMWTSPWMRGMKNHTILSYWGPMWMGLSMGLRDGSNSTAGEWRFVPAPTATYWGGTYLGVTKYCSDKNAAAGIIRSLCIDKSVLSQMAADGQFVNSVSIMTAMSNSSAGNCYWLAGQNPNGYLVDIAKNINVGPYDSKNNIYADRFSFLSRMYAFGEVDNIKNHGNYILTGTRDW